MATVNPIAPQGACPPVATYRPNRALGRTGYRPPPADRLGVALESLDGLLCLLTMDGDGEGDAENDFQRMNGQMQCAVLQLASHLAHEVHELHLQLNVYGDSDAPDAMGERQ